LSKANAYADARLGGAVSSERFDDFRADTDRRFHTVDQRLDRVGAMGSAMAGMAGAIAAAAGTDHRVSAAVGGYRGEGALAVGYAHRLPANGAVLLGGAMSRGGESTGSVGVSFGW
jgi:autotransporter adhesin